MNDFYSNYEEMPRDLSAEYDWQQRNRGYGSNERLSTDFGTGNDDEITTAMYSAYQDAVARGDKGDAKFLMREIKKRTLQIRNPDDSLRQLKQEWETLGGTEVALSYGAALIRAGQVVPFSVGYRMIANQLSVDNNLWAALTMTEMAPWAKPILSQAVEIGFSTARNMYYLVKGKISHVVHQMVRFIQRMGWLTAIYTERYLKHRMFFIHPSILDVNVPIKWVPGGSKVIASNALLNPSGRAGNAIIVGEQNNKQIIHEGQFQALTVHHVWAYNIQDDLQNGSYDIIDRKSALVEYTRRLLGLHSRAELELILPDEDSEV